MKKTAILFMVLFVFISNAALSQVTAYSFTAGTAIYNSITGISPVLTGDGTDPTRDEGFANNIPLGFTFNYLGTNYTTISASTNGFAAFGTITTPGFSNNIAIGGTGRPLLAPFWEDIALAGAADLQYTTTGVFGSRVFILQWNNAFFDYAASDASLSFQLRLYETTNVIEFIYNQLTGPVQDFSGGASIGITGPATGSGSFLSLNNSSASPTVSSVVAVNTITTRPVPGQVYTFTPPACTGPGNLSVTNITATSATLSWMDAPGGISYEYAMSTSMTPPASGTSGTAGTIPISGLTPGTQYYLHVRTNCGGTFSGWNSLGFATVCDAANVPYTMPISDVVCPALPLCTSVSDVNQDGNTWRSYPSGGHDWTDQVLAYVYNINGTTPANDWLFTRALNLEAGTYYRLRFKYNNDFNSLYAEKLKVAYGNTNTAAAMTNALADYPAIFSDLPQTVSIDFTPASSGIYYIGFQAYSDANKDVLILDDISVNLRPACDVPDTLAANVVATGTSATISWTAPSFGSPAGYEYAVIPGATPPASGTTTTSLSVAANGLTANTQYYLHVRTDCGGGAFSAWATLPFATVGNDEACKAIPLTAGGAPECSNNNLATVSLGDPNSNCSSPDHTVWYKYTATANGTIVLNITTPAAPANPLHGWAGWYMQSSNCPNISFYAVGYCAEFGNNGNSDVDQLISPVLTAGVTYFIMIDGYSNDVGEFCISIPACSPPLAVHASSVLNTSAKVSWNGTGTFILEYGPSGFIPGTGATAGAGGTVITPAVSTQTLTGLTILTTYDVYVRQNCSAVNNGFSNNSPVITFTTLGLPPVNDNCSGAVVLTVFDVGCGGAAAGNTLNATPSSTTPLPSCATNPLGHDDDIWYSFTPSAGQIYVTIDFESTGGNNDMVAQIYTSSNNTCSGTFSLFSCNDNGGTGTMPGFTSLPVTPGTTYFIRVFTDSSGANGQFTVCVTKALPINDNAAGAIKINVDAPCTGAVYTNAGATQTVNERWGECSSTKGYATVWYKFTAPSSGAVKISTAAGSGNTLTNTRVALFSATNSNDYGTFSIIGCDEDGGTGSFGSMSVLYAAGLTEFTTYYIQVDKFDSAAAEGSFCLTVETLSSSMLAAANNCNSVYQTPVGSVASYKGWVSLMDENAKLIALVKNIAGGPVNAYTVSQHINTGAVRKDITSGEYYLDRSFTINNTANSSAPLNVQLFFLANELSALTSVDPAAAISRLRVTRQTASTCQPDFSTTNGTNSELTQTANGTSNGVGWVRVNTTGFSNYYIHAVKSYLSAKVFLQGAYSTDLGRHKDVSSGWANVLNAYAKNQPYNNTASADTAREGFGSTTPGGTGQQIVHVTNLNATGPGSLRAAMGSNRTIVFDVGGTINDFAFTGAGINSVVNLTIDGSTAPSPGITLNNNNNGDCMSFQEGCHDIIIKHIRVRNAGNDGFNVVNAHDIVFDHVSSSGNRDGGLDITNGSYNITVQWSIFGTVASSSSGPMLIAYSPTKNISVHHNLFNSRGSSTEGARNPLVHSANAVPTDMMADIRNNVVWNWGNSNTTPCCGFGYGTALDSAGTANIVNNYYQTNGNQTQNAVDFNHNGDSSMGYVAGNVSGNNAVNPNSLSNHALWPAAAVATQDACTAATMVLAESGARPLDATDQALINAVSLTSCPGFTNQAPIANAGNNLTMVLPSNSTILTGNATDDDGTIVSYAWTRLNGPTSYIFGNANEATTTLSNLVAGIYVFRLTVTDNNGATGTDDVRIIVVNTGFNQTPVVNAGTNQTLTLPINSTTLSGSAFDADGTIATYTWTRFTGTGTYTFGTANAATTTLTNLTQGTYVFRLTVTDNNGVTGYDNVTIIVNAAPSASTTNSSYTGTETVVNGFFTSAPAATTDVLDWVLLEIKSAGGSTVLRRAAFVREDGQIVDLDGVSPVSLYGLASGNYYVTVRHRNHLGISTQNPLSFAVRELGVPPASATNFDFTTAADAAIYGDALAYKIINGVNVLIAGNANGNNNVRYGGNSNDPSSILTFLGSLPIGVVNNIYSTNDVNLDGTVKYGGSNNDTGYLLNNGLGGLPILIITEQKR